MSRRVTSCCDKFDVQFDAVAGTTQDTVFSLPSPTQSSQLVNFGKFIYVYVPEISIFLSRRGSRVHFRATINLFYRKIVSVTKLAYREKCF